jgi:hypothetical protein
MWPPNQKAGCVTHRAEIGADVARVGGEYEKNDELQQPVGVVFAEIAGDAAPRVRPMRPPISWIAAIRG